MSDEVPESTPGELEAETPDETSQAGSSPDTTDGEASEGEGSGKQTVPLRRFQEVNSRFRQAAQVANWYRENIGDPDDVVAFRRWKQQQAQAETNRQSEPEPPSGVTPQQLQAVRKLMRDADPDYRAMLQDREETQKEREAAEEAMFDDAYTEIQGLVKDNGIKLGDDGMLRLSRQVMLEIRNDPKLLRQWERRDIRCVTAAFDSVNHHLLKHLGGKPNGPAVEAATRRRASRLPTAPAGGTPTANIKLPAQKEKGINQETHARAFELLQQSSRE